jgi:Spx/MgsR family transcriptional regulator
MLDLYGIPNCDTVKRARLWLDQTGLSYRFHDFKKTGAPAELLQRWVSAVGWERLLNRQGSTWRKLDPQVQQSVTGEARAIALLQAQPSLIKRPVARWPDGTLTVGFEAEAWHRLYLSFTWVCEPNQPVMR